MTNFALLFVIVAAAFTSSSYAQSISVGNGNIIYQILFSQWANPAGKLYTGASCHFISKTCDTRFTGYVDILSDASARNGSELTWPGPNKNIKNWAIIGQNTYKLNDLTDFAYLNLTGVEKDKFREAILRVKVLDAGYLYSDEINAYVARLPGLREIGVTQYEMDAKFSLPIELGSLSSTLPGAVKAGKTTNRGVDQQMHLFAKVRAWGADIPKSRSSIDKSGGSVNDAEEAEVNRATSTTEVSTSTDTLTSTEVPKRRHRHRHQRRYRKQQIGSDGDK